MKNVFTYGSLMFQPVWERVVIGRYKSSEATIHGFRRLAVIGKEHPGLVIAKGAVPMLGRVYFDVSDVDLARLDQFETERYLRLTVAATIDGDAFAAETYMALNLDELSDTDWDVERFEHVGLPKFLATYVAAHAPPKA
jgi:gamma-glutamylcyclotransferase (GGCT)/AIG2-like uncharacterized protein YtfP